MLIFQEFCEPVIKYNLLKLNYITKLNPTRKILKIHYSLIILLLSLLLRLFMSEIRCSVLVGILLIA